jgi:mannose-6-phosphate isomerase
MTALYPLRFRPILRRYLWGGRRLGDLLGKPLGEGDDYAESWEVCDRGDDQSVVADGALAGRTLGELVRTRGGELLGRHAPQPRFPLLFKFLDARRHLSVQVHPDDSAAARLNPADLGKTEAWVVLEAEPGSAIYAGLKRGVDRPLLERELARGAAELCLARFEPRPGDCVYLPAGMPHAIGAGVLLAEIQQSSDATFRLYDWGRVGPDGQPRPLHVAQALDAIDFNLHLPMPQRPQPTDRRHVERIVACEKFILDRQRIASPESLGGDDRFHIVAVLSGKIAIAGDARRGPLRPGDTILVPASTGRVAVEMVEPAVVLDAYLP